jgi:hypothetical protein
VRIVETSGNRVDPHQWHLIASPVSLLEKWAALRPAFIPASNSA